MNKLYTQALKRVANTPELNKHYDTIFYDWPNWNEHLEWVCSASVKKIVEWAEQIEEDWSVDFE